MPGFRSCQSCGAHASAAVAETSFASGLYDEVDTGISAAVVTNAAYDEIDETPVPLAEAAYVEPRASMHEAAAQSTYDEIDNTPTAHGAVLAEAAYMEPGVPTGLPAAAAHYDTIEQPAGATSAVDDGSYDMPSGFGDDTGAEYDEVERPAIVRQENGYNALVLARQLYADQTDGRQFSVEI